MGGGCSKDSNVRVAGGVADRPEEPPKDPLDQQPENEARAKEEAAAKRRALEEAEDRRVAEARNNGGGISGVTPGDEGPHDGLPQSPVIELPEHLIQPAPAPVEEEAPPEPEPEPVFSLPPIPSLMTLPECPPLPQLAPVPNITTNTQTQET